MEAILKFNLDSPEDREEHLRCLKATDAYLAIADIHNLVRKYNKYGLDYLRGKSAEGIIESLYQEILDITAQYVNIDKELS